MKHHKRERGFTLVELVFVIAIITVLASIFLPLAIEKLSQTDEAVADASIQEIAAALTSFFNDLRHFPTCSSATDCSPFPGSENDLVFLAFGTGFGSLTGSYPDNSTGATNWDLTNNDDTTTPAKNNGANHLVQNDPNASLGADEGTDYELKSSSSKKRWRGPYLARVDVDPWGRTFIAYVGAMEKNGQTVAGSTGGDRGWILSAGPNNSLNTVPTDNTLSSDDRGFVFHTD